MEDLASPAANGSTEVTLQLPVGIQRRLDRLLRWQKRPSTVGATRQRESPSTRFSDGDGSYWDRWVVVPRPANIGSGFRRVKINGRRKGFKKRNLPASMPAGAIPAESGIASRSRQRPRLGALERFSRALAGASTGREEESSHEPTQPETKQPTLGSIGFVDPSQYRVEADGWVSASEQARAHRAHTRRAHTASACSKQRASAGPAGEVLHRGDGVYAHYRFQRLTEAVYPGLRESSDELDARHPRTPSRPGTVHVFPQSTEAQDEYLATQGHGSMLRTGTAAAASRTIDQGGTSPTKRLHAESQGLSSERVPGTSPGSSRRREQSIPLSPLRRSIIHRAATSVTRRQGGSSLQLPFVRAKIGQIHAKKLSMGEVAAEANRKRLQELRHAGLFTAVAGLRAARARVQTSASESAGQATGFKSGGARSDHVWPDSSTAAYVAQQRKTGLRPETSLSLARRMSADPGLLARDKDSRCSQSAPKRPTDTTASSLETHADFQHMGLGSQRCAAIARGLRAAGGSGDLVTLNVRDNRLSNSDIGALCACIVGHKKLKQLDVSENMLRLDITSAHRPAYSSNVGAEGNATPALYSRASPTAVEGLCMVAKGCKQLASLNVSDTAIETSGMISIVQAIHSGAELRVLRIAGNRFGSSQSQDGDGLVGAGIASLFAAIAMCEHLLELDISDNGIHGPDWAHIFESLATAPALEQLDLSKNRLGLEGASAMALHLPRFGCIRHIRMQELDLDEGLSVLVANAILASGSIRRVSLDGNRVGSLAGTALMYWSLEEPNSLSITNCSVLSPLSGSRHLWWTPPEHLHAKSRFTDSATAGLKAVNEIEVEDPAGYFELFALHPVQRGVGCLLARLCQLCDCYSLEEIEVSPCGQFGVPAPRAFCDSPGLPSGRSTPGPDQLLKQLALDGKLLARSTQEALLGELFEQARAWRRKMRDALPGAEYPVSCGPVIRLRLRFKPRPDPAAADTGKRTDTASHLVNQVKRLIADNSFTEAERAWAVKLAARMALFSPEQARRLLAAVTQSALDEMDMDAVPRVQRFLTQPAGRVVTAAHRIDMLRALMARMSSDGGGPRLMKAVAAAAERKIVREQLGQLAQFEAANPTGSYSIRLANVNDRLVLEQLFAMESDCKSQLKQIPKEFRRHDTSQLGDRSNFRNVRLDQQPFRLAKGATPTSLRQMGSLLEFDFVSTLRPQRDAPVFTNCQLCELLEGLDMLLACAESNAQASAGRAAAAEEAEASQNASGAEGQTSDASSPASPTLHQDPLATDRDDIEATLPHPELLSASFTLHLRKWQHYYEDLGDPREMFAYAETSRIGDSGGGLRRPGRSRGSGVFRKRDVTKGLGSAPISPTSGRSPSSSRGGGLPVPASGAGENSRTPSVQARYTATPTPKSSRDSTSALGSDGLPDPGNLLYRRIGNALMFLRKMTTQLYLTPAQVDSVLQAFPAKPAFARMEAAIVLFCRQHDMQSFWVRTLDLFSDESARIELLSRLGWLNVVNPDFPDRYFELDLQFRDDRELADVMTVLAVAEPGENFIGEAFANPKPVPGWELPESWYTTGPPESGKLTFTYTSKGPGCLADWNTRALLRRRFLVFNNWTDWDPTTAPSVLEGEGGLAMCDATTMYLLPNGLVKRDISVNDPLI